MLKIIHTADWHLRDMQFGRTSRSQDFTEAVCRVIDIAAEKGARYILCAGDLLNTNKPSSKNIRDLVAINDKLLSNKIELLVVSGNHDQCSPSWIQIMQEQLSAHNLCAMYDIDFKTHTLTGDAGEEYVVYGVPDVPPDEFRDKKSAFFAKADILLVHALVKDFAAFDAGDKALSVADLPTSDYAAILLGDIHTHKYMRVDNKCLVGYPGSTELCSRSESPEKYVALVTLTGKHLAASASYESIPLPLSRTIILRDVKTVDEANALILDVNALKDKNPTVLVRKSPEFNDLYGRLASVLDASKSILRVTNIPKANNNVLSKKSRRVFNSDARQLKDFAADFFPKDTALFKLAQTLCDPSAKPAPAIEEFINLQYADQDANDQKFGEA